MMFMKRFLTQGALALVGALIFSSCGNSSNRDTENATSVRVLQAVNQERAERGLGRVVADTGLQKIAVGHGGYLARNVYPSKRKPTGAVAHANFQGRARRARKEKYQVLSEVVMIGYAGDLSAVPQRTIKGWLNSPDHREAILNKDRKVMGIETRLPEDGRYFVVGLLSNGQRK